MGNKFQEIIKFLVPEMQIVDTVNELGFTNSKGGNVYNAQKQQYQAMQYGGGGQYIPSLPQNVVGDAVQNVAQSFQNNNENMSRPEVMMDNIGAVGEDRSARQINSAVAAATKVIDKFEGIETELRNVWVSSLDTVEGLVGAFKRPYVMGYSDVKPKNSMIVIGGESRGKCTGIVRLTKIMKDRKITKSENVTSMDLEKYASNADESLFLTDLYRVLYGKSEVAVFENVDKVYYKYKDILYKLMVDGVCELNKRYVMQNNALSEATGVLNANTVSQISSNGKFFVFTSCVREEKLVENLGHQFMSNVNDIITLRDFTQDELLEVLYKLENNLIEECFENLQFGVGIHESLRAHIFYNYSSNIGVKGLYDYIINNIYKPLGEIRLRNSYNTDYMEVLVGYNEEIIADFGGGSQVSLSGLIKSYDGISLDKIKEELSTIIGLEKVKEYVLGLENNYKVQKMRENQGLRQTDISMHMIFTGNPGTGKTTIARIVAKYLKALGVLSKGQLVEVSRAELVGQYVGQTSNLARDVIKSAVGGVLFIDEAYSLCREKNDTFGLEAIDTLVKGMEDNRDDLVVILAGYEKEMEEFIKTNPGLKSRFPNIINFEDYTPEDMVKIADITASSKGYVIEDDVKEGLLYEFERRQIKGRNDSGNGRLVRNVIEAAIINQSQRVITQEGVDLTLLKKEDFGIEEKSQFNLDEELDKIIGLDSIKKFVKEQYHLILAREKRRKANLKVDTTQSLNMVFMGNPGTGKTTIARVVADMFHEMGILKSGHLVEVDKGDLIAEYVGQTTKKTTEVFKSALGGILFIDEAYSITSEKAGFGQECVDTLIKLIEDYRGEILVILAGYTKEMDEFMESNSGLDSRFPLRIEFPDYSAEELYKIGYKMIMERGFLLNNASNKAFAEEIIKLKKKATNTSGNGRMVRNLIDSIIRKQSTRIALEEVSEKEMNLIIAADIRNERVSNTSYDLEGQLSKVVGLEEVKNYIRGLNARLRVIEERKKAGLMVDTNQTMHMIFKGNPGTGKTMMARIIAEVLADMGVISTNKLVETDRSGLVAGYVGQTAIKTKKVIESALGGVLFIDEAYSLAQGGNNDFGREAIDTLVKMMDDNRDNLVVILAGYNNDMLNFLNQNVGLKSRFSNIIEFSDYSVEELMHIADKMYGKNGYILTEEARQGLQDLIIDAKKDSQFGNGRFVRNVYERSLNKQALRLSSDNNLSKDDLVTITVQDIKGGR